MSRIIDFSLNNRFLVLVLWLMVVAVGLDSLAKLPIDAVPDVTNVQVQILTNSPGLPPAPEQTSCTSVSCSLEIRYQVLFLAA